MSNLEKANKKYAQLDQNCKSGNLSFIIHQQNTGKLF